MTAIPDYTEALLKFKDDPGLIAAVSSAFDEITGPYKERWMLRHLYSERYQGDRHRLIGYFGPNPNLGAVVDFVESKIRFVLDTDRRFGQRLASVMGLREPMTTPLYRTVRGDVVWGRANPEKAHAYAKPDKSWVVARKNMEVLETVLNEISKTFSLECQDAECVRVNISFAKEALKHEGLVFSDLDERVFVSLPNGHAIFFDTKSEPYPFDVLVTGARLVSDWIPSNKRLLFAPPIDLTEDQLEMYQTFRKDGQGPHMAAQTAQNI